MCPNTENIIDISKPYQKLKLLCIKEISSILSIKVKAYVGANLVTMAVPDIWCLTSLYIYI